MFAPSPRLDLVRGPRGLPGLGNLLAFGKDPLGFLTRLREDFGDAVSWPLGPLRNVLVSHPQHIGEVFAARGTTFDLADISWALQQISGGSLIRSSGAQWRRKRSLIQATLRPRQVRAHAATMVDCARSAADTWHEGERIDVGVEMAAIAQRNVVRTLFGNDTGEQTRALCDAVETAVNAVGHEMRSPTLLLPDWVPTPYRRRVRAAIAVVDAEMHRLIRARLDSPDTEERDDLLSRLLRACDEHGHALSPREVRDEALGLWTVGHETTAMALTWTLYCLSHAPAAYARLEAELADVLAGRPPALEDYDRLVWTRQIINEALRLYPPGWLLTTVARDRATIGGTAIPAGTVVWCSQWVTHRDPRWFPDPDVFRPERWNPASADPIPDHAWFPFGGGPRGCPGSRFALVETTLVLATLTQRFRFDVPGDVAPYAALSLRPAQPVHATVHKRTQPLRQTKAAR
ncbi:cytochrome P450 [Streptomyces racemochromogenes]|uniref:Cytochrome P450 n=1 Tax=Streptomyces racemochromogenes TaxID=67353 RepID=A0ABW7PI15_9ACTN